MIPRTDLTALSFDTPYEKVIDVTQSSGFSRIPIYEDNIDRIIGIFHTKDLINIDGTMAKPGFLATNLRPAVFVPESKKISEVLRMFQQDRTHMAIVVDEFGGTAGIVTMEDIIEELLGDIHDEFDVKEDRILRLPGGGLMADARVAIDDLEGELGIEFPPERDYESLGGFLMEVAGEVPAAGWQHVFEGYSFQVSEADANRLIRVRIDPIATGEESSIAVEDSETTPVTD
jgi:CBS domain containing-hemolysin-like protein